MSQTAHLILSCIPHNDTILDSLPLIIYLDIGNNDLVNPKSFSLVVNKQQTGVKCTVLCLFIFRECTTYIMFILFTPFAECFCFFFFLFMIYLYLSIYLSNLSPSSVVWVQPENELYEGLLLRVTVQRGEGRGGGGAVAIRKCLQKITNSQSRASYL